eukprot:5076192-Prymnesium_polylepis.1
MNNEVLAGESGERGVARAERACAPREQSPAIRKADTAGSCVMTLWKARCAPKLGVCFVCVCD